MSKPSEPKIDFKWLDAKCTGGDTIAFRLEDGALVKVKVDLERAGVAVNFTNPDGTPHYSINVSSKVNVIPASKTFSMPRSQLPTIPKTEADTSRMMT